MSTYAELLEGVVNSSTVLDSPLHVLILDDREGVREVCEETARSLGLETCLAADPAEALSRVGREHIDIFMAGTDDLLLQAQVRALSPQTQYLSLGPMSPPLLVEKLRLSLENLVRKLTGEKTQGRYGQILGRHASMRKLFEKMARVSQNQYPVLIQGESGTGKELVARSIHESGPRSRGPFLPVDCGALVPTLIESELFGHVRGAFTGASQTKQGLLEVAQGGTVFLDEIGELPLDLQAKLLRALQEKEIRPVGGTRCIHIDVRIIAATNRDLERAVEQGTFRKDLYFRLNVVRLRVPPLRERKTDILLLIDHFMERFTVPGQPRPAFSEQALRQLLAHDWPGNIRELENCVERAVALGSGPVLDSADLASNVQNSRPLPLPAPSAWPADPAFAGPENIVPLAELERRAIFQAIADAGGDKILAARLLGIGKTTLYRKLKEYKQG